MSSAADTAKQKPSQQLGGHKRNASRVAIPLSLTKPRTKAPTQKATTVSKSEDKETGQKTEENVNLGESHNGGHDVKLESAHQDGDSGDTDSKELEASTSSAAPSLGHESQTSSEDVIQPATPAPNEIAASKPPIDQSSKSRPTSIRTHLPPAFVPSSSPTHPQSHGAHRHQHHLSQSFTPASSSPSAVFSPHSDATFPPRRHHQPSYQPFNHAHHVSDTSNAAFPNNYPTSPAPWQQHYSSQQVHTPQYSHFNPAFRYPSRESFSSVQHPNSAMNFHSDSHPVHPTDIKYPPQDQRYAQPFSPAQPDPRIMAVMPPTIPIARQVNENLNSLSQHLATFYTSQTYSDVKLEVVLEQGDDMVISGHKLVFARSQRLQEVMTYAFQQGDGAKVRVTLPGKWMSLSAFSDAIEWLYGSVPQRLSSLDPAVGAEVRNEQLKHVLGVVAAGQWLKIFSVSRRALEMIRPLLTWDNVMLAIRFALEPEINHQSNGSSAATHNSGASQLLNVVMAWMTTEFPPNFYPDTNAAQLAFHQRFPSSTQIITSGNEQSSGHSAVTHKASRSTNDPRLSRIRFGEIDGETSAESQHSSTTSVSSIISSVLFSLPFELLKFFLEHVALSDRLGAETVGSITRQVVVEREVRRRRALQTYKQQRQSGEVLAEHAVPEKVQLDNLFNEEVVDTDPNTPSGLHLRSRRAAEI